MLEQPESDQKNNLCSGKISTETPVIKEGRTKKERKIFFETKTMAEVYVKQGYTAIALEIYKRIFQKNPSDSEAQKRILELETKLFRQRRI